MMPSRQSKINTPKEHSMKPRHLKRAEEFLDMDERNHTKKLDKYLKKYTGWRYSVISTPWCAAFVNAIMGEAGYPTTGSFMARSFMKWGEAVDTPKQGDIVVFSRGKPPSGHVAFYMRNYDKHHIVVLGGNQNDEVCMRLYRKDKVLGYKHPVK